MLIHKKNPGQSLASLEVPIDSSDGKDTSGNEAATREDGLRPTFPGIPDEVLHIFACDCAERALLSEQTVEISIQEQAFAGLEIKRSWLKGLATDQELLHAYKSTHSSYMNSSGSAAHWSAHMATNITVSPAVSWAANSAVQSAIDRALRALPDNIARAAVYPESALQAGNQEKEWQRKHLRDLMIEYFWRPFCEAIAYTIEANEKLEQERKRLEEALFHEQ